MFLEESWFKDIVENMLHKAVGKALTLERTS